MSKSIFALLIFFGSNCLSQTIFKKNEILAPLQPYTLLSGSKFVQFEKYKDSKNSTLFTIGHQSNSYGHHMWSMMDKYSGFFVDIGRRWYWIENENTRFRPYISINARFEKSSFKLNNRFNVPPDSLKATGFVFAPEINTGFKLIVLKRITINPMIGLRHYFNSYNSEKISKNEQYWAYNDWDNPNPNWHENRKVAELQGFRKGLSIIPYLNFGYRF